MMKATGVTRKIDHLGRVVLPSELRRTMDLGDRAALEFYIDGNQIVLRKYEPACVFCGSAEDVEHFMGKKVCHDCLSAMLPKEAVASPAAS